MNEPGPPSILKSAQSLKTINSFHNVANPFKKHEFSPIQIHKAQVSEVKCPEEVDSPLKS